jgi:O-antigen ligase
MFDKLIFILPGVVLLLFLLNLLIRGNTSQSALIFILAFLPFMDLKVTKEAWGGFKIFDALCFTLFLLYFKDFITINLRNRTNLYFLLFVMLTVIILISGLSSEFPDKTFLVLFKTLPIFIFSRFMMSACVKDPEFHLMAIKALKVALLSTLIFLGLQFIFGLRFTFYPGLGPNTFDPVSGIIRYPGIFYDSQAHGQFLAMGGFILLYLAQIKGIKWPWLNYALFAGVIIALNLAGSRAAFGGMAFGVLVSFFVAAKKYRVYGIITLVIGYFAFTAISYESTVLKRSKNFSEDLKFRAELWDDALEIVKANPFIGIGSGNYQQYIIRHDQDQYLEIEDGKLMYFDQPESGYLKIMVELGLIGFFVFAMYLIAPVLGGFQSLMRKKVPKRSVFLIGGLLSWVLAFSTVYSIFDYRILILVAGLIVLIVSHPLVIETYREEHDQ